MMAQKRMKKVIVTMERCLVLCFDVDDGLILAIFPILLGFRCHMSYNVCVKFIKYGDLQILCYMLRIGSVDCCI